jgi:hypothetical protein
MSGHLAESPTLAILIAVYLSQPGSGHALKKAFRSIAAAGTAASTWQSLAPAIFKAINEKETI